MKPLRILLLNWRCPKHPNAGGAEKATYEIARRWVQQGHKVHWVSANFAGGSKNDYVDGISITRIGNKYTVYLNVLVYYWLTLKGQYDVVIDEVNTIPFFTPLYVRSPRVAFIHQLAANVLFEELPWIQAKLLSLLEPCMLRLYKDTPIITSQSTRGDLLKLGLIKSNLHVITYGVDHDVYKPGQKSVFPHVFYLGRLMRFKGVHILIEAMQQVVKKLPTAKLSIVGRGEREYEYLLKQLRDNLGLRKNVIFYNFGFHDSLSHKVKLMQEAWVLVFPSAREGFGLVVVEANSCGAPTVATDVPGLRDTVRDNITGILVHRNIDALASAIVRLLSEPELRAQMSRNAYIWSLRFNWDLTAKKILLILRDTIDNRKKAQF